MDKIDAGGLEGLLGISFPWSIQSVVINSEQQLLEVFLEYKDQKKRFGLFDSSKKDNLQSDTVEGKWVYMPIGKFSTIIHARVAKHLIEKSAIGLETINQPSFLGHPGRSYSNHVRQAVAQARIRGTDEKVLSEYLNISSATVQTIITDLHNCRANLQTLTYLPTETNPIWAKVLTDQLLIRTELLPLKLLLSKLKLNAAKLRNTTEMPALINELRKFFIANAHLIDKEVDQLCGLVTEKARRRATVEKTKQRLILPALKNPVWIDLITGRLKLNSQSVPLNLLISRQRVSFIQGKENRAKVRAIETLREYFRQNYRSLKAELILINRAIAIKEKSELQIPNADHQVWQSILGDDSFIPSSNVAYKLLLAKLRTQTHSNHDPVIKLNAAKRIRDFIQQNKKSMRQELSMLIQQSKAI